jgi:dTDP-4-dehydrorhamnose reductase
MILATGAGGMTGSHLLEVFRSSEIVRTDLRESEGIEKMDVRDLQAILRVMERVRPHLVIHLAAETDVDYCQTDPDHAFRSNYIGTLNVALACQRYGAELAYVSTAGIFDGGKVDAYNEFDHPNPINAYAKSKLEGEHIVQALLPRHYILRAGWMFGGSSKDKKFVGKIAAQCLEGGANPKLRAVNDKFGSPTYAADFLHHLNVVSRSGFFGTYHLVNEGRATRFDVARAVADFLQVGAEVEPVSSSEFVLPAERPTSEYARAYKMKLAGMDTPRDWRLAIRDYLTVRFPEAAMASQSHAIGRAATGAPV